MINQIKSDKLITVINELIQKSNNSNDDFKAGMDYLLKGVQNYIKGPPFVLNEEFKKFALKEFLDNDEIQLAVFSNLIELFEIKMLKYGRTSTWNIYPDDMSGDVRDMLKECFDGVNFLRISTDFDRSAGDIDLHVSAVAKKDEDENLSFYASDYHINFNDDDDDEDYYDLIEGLNKYIKVQPHYETLLLTGCLKKMFKYINAQKVEELLNKEKQ